MCFVCHFCKKQQTSSVSAHKIVTQYRQFEHPVRAKAMRRKVVKNGKYKMEYITDPGGFGLQIAKEVLGCPNCANEWNRKQRERQGLLPVGQSAKIVLPLLKQPTVKEPEPRPRRPYTGHRPSFRNSGPRPQPSQSDQGGYVKQRFPQ